MREAVRALAAAAALVAVAALPVRAQPVVSEAPSSSEFLSRFDFQIVGAGLAADDPHFSWDTHWTGDFDLVDYVYGRLGFRADYEAILGNEFRPFDPYQSNYYLSISASLRRDASNEWALVFEHVSRHLGDRPKRDPVAYNAWMVRVLKRIEREHETIDVTGNIGPIVARAWVDYNWLGNVDVTVRHPLRSTLTVYGRGFGETFGTDEDVAGRGQQWGGRLEAGLRFSGRGAALDVFGGFERMIDADPLDRLTRQWALAGFRLTGM
jgi:hypothetical protein